MINAQIAAQRLKKLRVDKGLSHQKLSEALSDFGVDVSPRSLMNYESAAKDEFHSKSQSISKMNASTLVALAEFFDVSTDYLLGLNDAPTADIEVQAITDYTGLSVESVKILHIQNLLREIAKSTNANSNNDTKYVGVDTYLLFAVNILIEKFCNTDFFKNFLNYLYSNEIELYNPLPYLIGELMKSDAPTLNRLAIIIEKYEKSLEDKKRADHRLIDPWLNKNPDSNTDFDIITNSFILLNRRLGIDPRPFPINDTTTEAVSMLMLQQTLKRIKDQLHDSPDE